MDCFVASLLAMTAGSAHRHRPLRCHRPPTGRPNGRPMTGSGGRSSTLRLLDSIADAGVYWMPAFAGMTAHLAIPAFFYFRHSGAREARTRNLEIPGLVLRTIPE